MAANLAITRTTQCEVTQEDLMRDPRNERKLGIWKTKRDPGELLFPSSILSLDPPIPLLRKTYSCC